VLRVLNRIRVQTAVDNTPEPEGEGEPLDEFESALDDIASDVCLAWEEGSSRFSWRIFFGRGWTLPGVEQLVFRPYIQLFPAR
jgi:hypothetical protein